MTQRVALIFPQHMYGGCSTCGQRVLGPQLRLAHQALPSWSTQSVKGTSSKQVNKRIHIIKTECNSVR